MKGIKLMRILKAIPEARKKPLSFLNLVPATQRNRRFFCNFRNNLDATECVRIYVSLKYAYNLQQYNTELCYVNLTVDRWCRKT